MDSSGKAAVTSVGVMGPAAAILVLLLNRFVFKGNVITDADVSGLIDLGTSLFGLVTGIWGRVRATKQITAVVKAS